ncbi:hypothetical protein ACFTUC_39490 [Streptomyces sp. NPDC056944]|uniref:hypothetical protein n=1 Tax=unclassified Streptomyces TaxID=2593676 RepID=UPI00362FDCE4
MTGLLAPPSRMAVARRRLTTLLLTAGLVTAVTAVAVAAADPTAGPEARWPRTGGAFTPATSTHGTPAASVPGTGGQDPAACGAGLDRASCTRPSSGSIRRGAGLQAGPALTPKACKPALPLLPAAGALTVMGRPRTREAIR